MYNTSILEERRESNTMDSAGSGHCSPSVGMRAAMLSLQVTQRLSSALTPSLLFLHFPHNTPAQADSE